MRKPTRKKSATLPTTTKATRARNSAKRPSPRKKPTIFIFGAGKVGRALARALTEKKYDVTLRPARKGLPRSKISASCIILSVRDRDLAKLADEIAEKDLVEDDAVVLHNAGALGSRALDALRAFTAGVAQFHPMISFASTKIAPALTHGNAHIEGDPAAVRVARELAVALDLTPRTIPNLDTVGYHAAAGLVANGSAALAAVGAELLERAGVPANVAVKMLGPLLRSVAENVEALGFPEALTGPVRRGDAGAVHRQIALLREKLPSAIPLFVASIGAQIPLAKRLGEASPEAFEAIEQGVRRELAALTSPLPT